MFLNSHSVMVLTQIHKDLAAYDGKCYKPCKTSLNRRMGSSLCSVFFIVDNNSDRYSEHYACYKHIFFRQTFRKCISCVYMRTCTRTGYIQIYIPCIYGMQIRYILISYLRIKILAMTMNVIFYHDYIFNLYGSQNNFLAARKIMF